jgi:putative methionine-R-sulfoxide reductase with GAF domain
MAPVVGLLYPALDRLGPYNNTPHDVETMAETRSTMDENQPPYDAEQPSPGAAWTSQNTDAASALAAAGEDDDLRASLTALSQLATGRMELTDVLTRVAEYAVLAIPGADGAGLTLLEAGHHDTIVASAPFVVQVDAIQYGIGQGPCITAAAQGRTVRSGSLDTDVQWPQFGARVARLAVHSALSLPLVTATGVLGAMNVYAHERDAFTDHAALIGEMFAVPAAIAVQNAQVLAQAQRLAAQLSAALGSRAIIDQAVGLVMARVGCTPEEAFAWLSKISQTENRKLNAVAGSILDEAVRRAQARRPPT